MLREFEGRSPRGDRRTLGCSPKQAKALIHRAKKSFRRAWDQGSERRGVAALAPIILLAPSPAARVPSDGSPQPAHDVVATATATAQQAAVQVTAAPVAVHRAISMADKVTAAAITVIVAGTVSVGAVAIQHTQKPSKPTPTTASPALVPVAPAVVLAPEVTKRRVEPHHEPHQKPHGQTQGGEAPTGTVPVETPTESPAPTEPSPSPGPDSPAAAAPRPLGPARSRLRGVSSASLSQISQRVTGQRRSDAFCEVMQGALVDEARRCRRHRLPGLRRLDLGGQRLAVQPLAVDRHPWGSTGTRRPRSSGGH